MNGMASPWSDRCVCVCVTAHASPPRVSPSPQVSLVEEMLSEFTLAEAKMLAMLGDGEKKGGALPEGRPVSDAIESELEALRKKANDM